MGIVKSEFLVLGGGISGLMATRSLEDREHEVTLLERSPGFGGLTRTVQVDKYCFDYTGHFLHLNRYVSPADIPYAGLDNSDWMQVDRRSVCYIADTFIPAPVQYNIGLMPEPERSRCIESYRNRSTLSDNQSPSFRDYVIAGFGEYLADLFLIPQNEKTMAIALDGLSASALKRFFPKPDETLVKAGIDQRSKAAKEYNSNFWYPRQGGIGRLPDGLTRNIQRGFLNHEVVLINPRTRRLTCRNGQEFRWQHIVSSLPLKVLCHCVEDDALQVLSRGLSHSTTIAFNLGCSGNPPDILRGVHWVYVPDRTIPFYRVGLYSNISQGICSTGHHTLYVEVSVEPENLKNLDIAGELTPRVIEHLARLGWIDRKALRSVVTHVIECAYTHDKPERARQVGSIIERLEELGIHTVGRYGMWDYYGMEDSMQSSLDLIERIC
ncbi:MAG: FAD-dependent oxidoreductase [Gammaproteobacteria bacterium]